MSRVPRQGLTELRATSANYKLWSSRRARIVKFILDLFFLFVYKVQILVVVEFSEIFRCIGSQPPPKPDPNDAYIHLQLPPSKSRKRSTAWVLGACSEPCAEPLEGGNMRSLEDRCFLKIAKNPDQSLEATRVSVFILSDVRSVPQFRVFCLSYFSEHCCLYRNPRPFGKTSGKSASAVQWKYVISQDLRTASSSASSSFRRRGGASPIAS